jgi:hypothetical protein
MIPAYGDECRRCGEIMRKPYDESHAIATDHKAAKNGYCRHCWIMVAPALQLEPDDPVRIAILKGDL